MLSYRTYNESYKQVYTWQCKIPDLRKISATISLYKKGNGRDMSSYGGVSINSTLSKSFGGITKNKLNQIKEHRK